MTGLGGRTIVLHGPESVGKSALAEQLAERLRGVAVPEYGRDYCMRHGNAIGMGALAHIARRQTACIANARSAERPVIADTDALMTAVWADMMFGRRSPSLVAPPAMGDLYLLCDADLPFVDDGLRVFGDPDDRARFMALCEAELVARGVRRAWVRGAGVARLSCALDAIRAAFGPFPPPC